MFPEIAKQVGIDTGHAVRDGDSVDRFGVELGGAGSADDTVGVTNVTQTVHIGHQKRPDDTFFSLRFGHSRRPEEVGAYRLVSAEADYLSLANGDEEADGLPSVAGRHLVRPAHQEVGRDEVMDGRDLEGMGAAYDDALRAHLGKDRLQRRKFE